MHDQEFRKSGHRAFTHRKPGRWLAPIRCDIHGRTARKPAGESRRSRPPGRRCEASSSDVPPESGLAPPRARSGAGAACVRPIRISAGGAWTPSLRELARDSRFTRVSNPASERVVTGAPRGHAATLPSASGPERALIGAVIFPARAQRFLVFSPDQWRGSGRARSRPPGECSRGAQPSSSNPPHGLTDPNFRPTRRRRYAPHRHQAGPRRHPRLCGGAELPAGVPVWAHSSEQPAEHRIHRQRPAVRRPFLRHLGTRSEEHTSELQSLS
jgi:hypothetical protein